MKRKSKNTFISGLMFIMLFIVWTVAVISVDVKPVGVNGTSVGFATLNTWFHNLTEVNMTLYNITDWVGLVPIFICMFFGGVGLIQLIKRKSLLKVDFDIIALGIYYIYLLNGHDVDATKVPCGEIQSHVILGLNPGLINASGYSWTGDYVTVTGDLCADLLSNIASEQRAKVVYEYLYRQIDDKKVRETIDFLLNREEAHNQMFRDAFNKVQNSGSNRDFGTTKAAKMYFSMSDPGPNAFATGDTKPVSFDK